MLSTKNCLQHLSKLDDALGSAAHLCGARFTLADAALLPFVRQFHFCDVQKLEQWGLSHVQRWLEAFLESERFDRVMIKRRLYLDTLSDN